MRRFYSICVLCTAFLWSSAMAAAQEAFSIEDGEEATARERAYQEAPDKLVFLLETAQSDNEHNLAWAAEKLGDFDDPKALRALKQLATRQQAYSDGIVPSIQDAAKRSLERVAVLEEIRLMWGDGAFEDKLRTVRLLASSDNYVGRTEAAKFCRLHVAERSKDIVPVLVEYYAGWSGPRKAILQHLDAIGESLDRGLNSPRPEVVAGCIRVIGEVKVAKYLARLPLYVCADRDSYGGRLLIGAARDALVAFGDQAVPHLADLLASGAPLAQFDAIADLERIGTLKATLALDIFVERYGDPVASGFARRQELFEAARDARARMQERQ